VPSAEPRLRIAVVETARFGGLLHYAVQLADALADSGQQVDLIVPEGNELAGRDGSARRLAILPGWLPSSREVDSPVRIFVRRARTALARVVAWSRIVWTVRRGNYDVVVLNGSIDLTLTAIFARALIALSGRSTRVTHVCHNVRPFNRWGGEDLFVSSGPLLWLLRRLYPAFDRVFVHGERSRAEFDELWPHARVAVIPHGDEELFVAEQPPPAASEPRILFFGDWRKVKGLSVLMDAFDLLVQRMPEARLTVAGTPSYEEGEYDRVLAWAARHPAQVELLAEYIPIEQVPAIFARTRVVALPYLVAYQSGVLHLSMTMARAVVASDVGDLSSAVRDGETGLLVPTGDPAELARALERLLTDAALAERMGRAARERLEQGSSWSEVANRVLAALR
jgi:glycosyltransferase involved in cell wall biosynthesis